MFPTLAHGGQITGDEIVYIITAITVLLLVISSRVRQWSQRADDPPSAAVSGHRDRARTPATAAARPGRPPRI